MARLGALVLRYGFDSEVVTFTATRRARHQRLARRTCMPRVALDLTGPGYFVRPALAYRVPSTSSTPWAPAS